MRFIMDCIKTGLSGIAKIASCISTTVTTAVKGAFKVASATLSSLTATGGFIGSVATGASKLLSMVSTFITGPLGPIVGPIISHLVVEAIGEAIGWVAKKLGIIKDDDKVEEVGYRMEEAAKHDEWEKRETFGSFSQYHDYLKEKIPGREIDQVKMLQNRLGYMSLGISALKDGIGGKLGIDMPIDFLIEIGKSRLDGSELNALLDEFSAKGYDLSLFRQYLKGELQGDMRRAVEDSIFNALKSIYPDKTTEDLLLHLYSMRDTARNDAKILENYAPEIEMLTRKEKVTQTLADVPHLVNLAKKEK